ncbi:hypothetical protein QCA50_001183 [Cerrena zonata]|uniref:Uncharacterized protein n=1 Tax=Cerrena zonata TaxID=2478898 RepID=A0AAW0GTC6_9APHY
MFTDEWDLFDNIAPIEDTEDDYNAAELVPNEFPQVPLPQQLPPQLKPNQHYIQHRMWLDPCDVLPNLLQGDAPQGIGTIERADHPRADGERDWIQYPLDQGAHLALSYEFRPPHVPAANSCCKLRFHR